MSISVGITALLCIACAAALGFGVAVAVFLLMFFGFCKSSQGDLADGHRRQRGRNASRRPDSTGGGEAANAELGCKGIPLNSRPPRLTPEQEILREKVLEKYRRRQARQQRRRERQAAREARIVNVREGDGEGMASENEFDDSSSVTTQTTLKSAATTVRTASTLAYGRGTYLSPPPDARAVHLDEHNECDELHSAYSGCSRRSSGTVHSRTSQGTIATIKSYLRRQRQRQHLRRREKQQQIEIFNQWAQDQLAPSSDLSPSSKSSASLGDNGDENTIGGHARRGTGTPFGGCSSHHRLHPERSMSVASSEPRPPEEVLAVNCTTYPALRNGERGYLDRPCVSHHRQAPNEIVILEGEDESGRVESSEFECSEAGVKVCPSYTPAVESSGCAAHGGSGVGSGTHVDRLQPSPPKRTWKDVEHSVALSGFFSNGANQKCLAGAGLPLLWQRSDKETPGPCQQVPGELTKNSVGIHEPIHRE
ncbi:hypothetical protein JKF63_03925 [Porcisia hertigi]|uniref:Uncharacterized protein n=1 Tax=Porcisia hertigi TaxID=2761500 RepID=A0A836L7G8_9TRYP|nr:hypothetical protein JKF63_03925 [Porcisia hertigi]